MTNNLQNNWQVKSLGEVLTDIRYGMTASADFLNDGIKFLRVTDIKTNGSVDYSRLPNVVAKKNEAEKYFLLNGDCVIARSGSVGKAHIFNGIEEVVFASYLIRLRFNIEILYPPYFGAFSQTSSYWNQILSNTKGGVQQNINTDGLSRIKIPLPPLPIQKQIAEILEHADKAKQKRKEANKLTDEFLQSVFIEMFGDPAKNPRGWDKSTFLNLVEKFQYGTSVKSSQEGLPVLRIPNIIQGIVDLNDLKRVELSIKEVESLILNEGDILFVRTNGNPNNVGRCALFNLKDKFVFASYLIRAILKKDKVNPVFLVYLLGNSNYRNVVRSKCSTTAGQFNINTKGLGSLQIIYPPLSLQQQFAEIVNKTEVLKEKQKQSEQELENLFQSLMQKAFKGELV